MISTIREWLSSILGEYTPVTYNVTQVANDPDFGVIQVVDSYVAKGLAGVDWEYIFTALLLLVVIYSVFRLLGLLLQAFTGGGRY